MSAGLDHVTDFPALVEYLRDELEWPIAEADFEALTFDYKPEEVGLDSAKVGGGIEIKQLRPLNRKQPWGIFFVNLPKKHLSTTILRTLLGSLAPKKRASNNPAERAVFEQRDLMFIANTGEAGHRHIDFAHFRSPGEGERAPPLQVLGWDADDTERRMRLTGAVLHEKLHWPDADESIEEWRTRWTDAFREPPHYAVRQSVTLAEEMAKLARRIRDRAVELIGVETEKGALRKLHVGFKEALIHDLTPEKFADYYAQTITYGLFSARVSRPSMGFGHDTIHLNVAGTSPFLKEMLGQFLEAGGRKAGSGSDHFDFDALGVGDVVDLLEAADMDSVLADWDHRNRDEDPVVRFYEDFLRLYDPEEKKQRGVFYTPRSVVSFIVRSVDEVLRTEFGLEDGLASSATWADVAALNPTIKMPKGAKASDPFVRILDPATGTGTFLVECVDLIHQTMLAKWRKAGKRDAELKSLWNEYVPKHLLPRLTGFELMMAPYAIAHVKLGLKLADTGYTFDDKARAQIYLTNALEPSQDLNMQLAFVSEALAHEAKAANSAKETRFTVIMGNPPYAGHSGNNHIRFIVDLVADYTKADPTLRGPGQGKWLQDDYVKFLRFSQLQLDSSGAGVIGMITNHRFLTNRTFRGLRKNWLEGFSSLWFLDLHGNVTVQEVSPTGADDNVFDIEQGVSINVITLDPKKAKCGLSIGDLWGTRDHKYRTLDRSRWPQLCTEVALPSPPLYLFAKVGAGGETTEYQDWPSAVAAMPSIVGPNGAPQSGLATMHDAFAIAFTAEELGQNIATMLSTKTRADAVKKFGAVCNPSQWDYSGAKKFLAKPGNWKPKISKLFYAPLDVRYTVFDRHVAVHLRKKLSDHLYKRDNVALVISSAGQEVSGGEWDGLFCVDGILQLNFFRRNGSPTFPLFRYDALERGGRSPNFAPDFIERIAELTGLSWNSSLGVLERGTAGKTFGPRELFDYIYAVLHSPTFRRRYADRLKSAFPNIPLPGSRKLFEDLASIGSELVALHLLDFETLPILNDPKSIRLAGSGEARVTMPAARFEDEAYEDGRMYIASDKSRWFENVTEQAANFSIGGYIPARKWLKDRGARGGRNPSPGRLLTNDDILHYRRMIVALTRTTELLPKIDEIIEKRGGWPEAFRGMTDDVEAQAAE